MKKDNCEQNRIVTVNINEAAWSKTKKKIVLFLYKETTNSIFNTSFCIQVMKLYIFILILANILKPSRPLLHI